MSKSSNWQAVSDQAEAEALLDMTRGFHDSIATKTEWEGEERIDEAGYLESQGYGQLLLALNSQFKDVGRIELRFSGVESFRYEYALDAEASIVIEPGSVRARFGSWAIEAVGMEFRWAATGQ